MMLQLEQVKHTWGSFEIGPISLDVRHGERIAMLGASGAGKSSLLKVLSGESAPRSGAIHLDGKSLHGWRVAELSTRRAVLPQSSEIAFPMLCDLVIGLGRVSRIGGIGGAREKDIVQAAARQASASHLLGRRFDTLSGGEKARVQLARLFAQLWDMRDGLILVDEPVAALDPALQVDVLDAIDAFAGERNHATIAILHDINHALQGFDRLWLMRHGRLLYDLPANVSAAPALQDIYGIRLQCLRDASGMAYLLPLRR